MENHFTESGEATFFSSQPLSLFQRITSDFTESAENHFSLKNCLAELLDSAENQLWELCQTGPKDAISPNAYIHFNSVFAPTVAPYTSSHQITTLV
jgi:hypothetical protein